MATKTETEVLTGTAKRVSDQEELKKQNAEFLAKCKKDKAVKVKFPKAFAVNFGAYVTWTYNGIPVTAYFDGKEHEYPEFVANWLRDKISRCMDSFFPVNENTKLF